MIWCYIKDPYEFQSLRFGSSVVGESEQNSGQMVVKNGNNMWFTIVESKKNTLNTSKKGPCGTWYVFTLTVWPCHLGAIYRVQIAKALDHPLLTICLRDFSEICLIFYVIFLQIYPSIMAKQFQLWCQYLDLRVFLLADWGESSSRSWRVDFLHLGEVPRPDAQGISHTSV